jgi:hypothetical protein
MKMGAVERALFSMTFTGGSWHDAGAFTLLGTSKTPFGKFG